MENLHNDILENILSRLPVETALHLKRVSKTWREIIRYRTRNPGFLFSHGVSCGVSFGYHVTHQLSYEDESDHYDHEKINHYYYSYDTLTKIEHGDFITKESPRNILIGSCNGLLCLGRHKKEGIDGANPFLICNPLTKESVLLPEYECSEFPDFLSRFNSWGRSSHSLASGFGYGASSNDYKVVTIYYYLFDSPAKGHVHVYDVGGEWRYIGFIGRPYYTLHKSPGICANGALYWLDQSTKVQECEIVAFDLESEKFRSIPSPRSKDFEYTTEGRCPLKLLGGNNNLYLVHSDCRASRIDMWLYTRNSRNTGTSSSRWIKEFSIQLEEPKCYKPFAITQSFEILLWYKQYTPSRKRRRLLCCYDPKTSALNKLWDDKANDAEWGYIQAVPYRQTIVSLKELGETNVTSLEELKSNHGWYIDNWQRERMIGREENKRRRSRFRTTYPKSTEQ